MESFRMNKLLDAILIQSRLKKEEASELAKTLEESVDWEYEFNYQSIVKDELEKTGLLRSQNTKSCKIRRGTRLK